MSRFRVRRTVYGADIQYHVHRALGLWPLSNWSWLSDFSAPTREECEDWIALTHEMEGRADQIERERVLVRRARENRAAELKAAGFYYDGTLDQFVHPVSGEKVVAL